MSGIINIPDPDAVMGEDLALGDLTDADLAALEGAEAVENEDGSISFEEPLMPDEDLRQMPFETNFAEYLADDKIGVIIDDLVAGIDADIESNADYYAQLKEGMDNLGLKKERMTFPFDGAAGARHPLLLKAVVKFNAEAMGEMLPAGGPVRMQVLGDNPQGNFEEIANRKQKYLNYYLTEEDEGFYSDYDQSMLMLGVMGSVFRKVYIDPTTKKPVSRYRTPFNLVVSANSGPSLLECARWTEIDVLSLPAIKRLQVTGHYANVDLGAGDMSDDDENPALRLREAVGVSQSERTEDSPYTIYTSHVMLDLPGLEHLGPDGQPSGLPLPWVITFDRDSRKALRIERDWDMEDIHLRPREQVAHYKYLPGFGFYGLGLSHLLASSQDAATSMLRDALNSFKLVSFPGGFRAKGQRIEENNMAIGPCEFREIDTGGMPIRDAVMPLPYRDVPPSFAPLMQEITQGGEMIASVSDLQVGEGRQDAPVGSTLALIEQATKIESAVIKRAHFAQRQELRMLAKGFGKDPDAKYPFFVNGQANVALATDFTDTADIIPVSDPNVPTQVQRLQMAQAKLTLAQQSGGMLDVRRATMDLLRTMGGSETDVQAMFTPQQQPQPADPITEFGAVTKGMPLKAGPTQNHMAHIQAHVAQLQTPGMPPQNASALFAHAMEHADLLYRAEMSARLGVPLPEGQPIPPEIEAQLSAAVAAQSDAVMEILQQALGGLGGDPNKAAEMQIKREELAHKKEELAFKERESVRKAEASTRQEQGEYIALAEGNKGREIDLEKARQDNVTKITLGAMKVQEAAMRPEPKPPQGGIMGKK